MRYVSELIPARLKVLPEYFVGKQLVKQEKSSAFLVISYIASIFFFFIGLTFARHLFITFYYAIIGLLILPQGHAYVEKKGRFQFTNRIKAISVATLILFSLPVIGMYASADAEIERLAQIEQDRQDSIRVEQHRLEAIRADSFNFLVNSLAALEEQEKLDKAEEVIFKAEQISSLPGEKSIIRQEKEKLLYLKANSYYNKHLYKEALPLFVQLSDKTSYDDELLYNTAVCYQKLGNTQSAVAQLKRAISLGSEKAEKYYNKINPIRKRIIAYRTLCCDGTYSPSNAKGRGACSWHGGVCNWNAPVYETYRKYE